MFTLQIETDNAAFEIDPAAEISRILRDAADQVEHGPVTVLLHGVGGILWDINGNSVGSFRLDELTIQPSERRSP